tara:strand:- start:226 stop:483 length:258 start_codon:yes stop_codon:yes gene_type:complete
MQFEKHFLKDYPLLPKNRFKCIIVQDNEARYQLLRKFTKPTVKFQDPNISADAAVEAFVFNRFTPAPLVFVGNAFQYENSLRQSF